MKLKIFSPEDKQFRKKLNKLGLLFFLLLPLLNTLIIGTLNMYIDFIAWSYDSYPGMLAAQTLSVLSELANKFIIMCGLCVLIYAIHRYTVSYSGKYLLVSVLSPFATFVGALVSVYFLSVTGYHDITPINFVSELPFFIFSWLIGYFELLVLLCVASIVSVVYAGKKKTYRTKRGERIKDTPAPFATSKDTLYARSVKATVIIFSGILIITEIISTIGYIREADGFTANFFLETILTPYIILAIRILLVCLAAYLVSKLLDKKYFETFKE